MLVLKHLDFGYERAIFEDVNLKLPDTSLVCIYGKSGCGKTTLLKLIVGELRPRHGEIIYNGQVIDNENSDNYLFNHVSYVDQQGSYFNNMTVKQHFEFYGKLHDIVVSNDKIAKWLEAVNLNNVDIKKSPSYLSTGERKRLVIALAIMTNKEMLILDEPTASLDQKNKEIIIEVLSKLAKKMLVVCTSHDRRLLEQADMLCEIKDKQINIEKDVDMTDDNSKIKEKKAGHVNYFSYKNLRYKLLFVLIMIIGAVSIVYASLTISMSISLKLNIEEQTEGVEHGLVYYKLPDARLLGEEEYDFIEQSDIDVIKNIEGVKNIVPYYEVFDHRNNDDHEFSFEDKNGTETKGSYLSSKWSKKMKKDWYMQLCIRSYDPVQNIKIDGKAITGIYVDEELADIIGQDVSGGTIKTDFMWPVNRVEDISNRVQHYVKTGETINIEDVRSIKNIDQEISLTLKIDGVLPSNVYYGGSKSDSSDYVNIYMPANLLEDMLKKYDQSGQGVMSKPMTYLILCADANRDKVKLEIENINELYRAKIQGDTGTIATTDSSYLTVSLIGMVFVLLSSLLVYYQINLRKAEMQLLKREGLAHQINKYYLMDYYYLAVIWIVISSVALIVVKTMTGELLNFISLASIWMIVSLIFIIIIILVSKVSIRHVKGHKEL